MLLQTTRLDGRYAAYSELDIEFRDANTAAKAASEASRISPQSKCRGRHCRWDCRGSHCGGGRRGRRCRRRGRHQ